ncbi:MAG: sigma-70 family RNA polymerase sigma factor [Flavobacteriales bacterium]|jgi:RNA polymerase sigma factor (sigma-70 family)|nr:sigma-70 family RNA polymerase sigma factor [Flavobacteriales bacterium]MCB9204138.1 sigma-70 family RNA polymerase sigma factor [Flavobacteriales bacterium]
MRVSALSDQELIRLYVQGDEICFEELVNRHKDRLFTYLVLLLKDRKLAEDFFQDTLVKVINTLKSGKYLEEGKFRPWMLRIAHNLVIDHFRQQKKMRMQHSTEEFDQFSIMSNEDMNREELYIQDQIHSDLRKLVALLPEDQKEVLLMRVYAKMPFKEIAWVTEVSINTALGRMRYALIRLRQLMEEHNVKLVA